MIRKCPLCGTPMAPQFAADPTRGISMTIYQCPAAVQVALPGSRKGFFKMGYEPVPGFGYNPHEAFKDGGFYSEDELMGRTLIPTTLEVR